jgi:hypothetical protein
MATTALPEVRVRTLQDIQTALERHPEWRTALRQQLLGEELLELPTLFAKFATEVTRRLDVLDNDVGILKNDVGSLKNDVGILKGAHAEAVARGDIEVIADELGVEYRRTLPKIELRRIARDNGADLREDKIKSFLASDIMAEAADAQGNTTYLAVEASYTGDRHDADRAGSHAALMERFTNKPCLSIVASAQKDDRLVKLVDSGEVTWHELNVRIHPAS